MSYRYTFYIVIFLNHIVSQATDNQTSSFITYFVQSADRLTMSGDNMMPPMLSQSLPLASRSYSNPTFETAVGGKQRNRSKIFRTLKRISKKDAPFSSPYQKTSLTHLTSSSYEKELAPKIPRERISDMYFSALSLYHAGHQESSPLPAMHIRIQITHIIEQLTKLYAPINLFADSTVYEAGYKEIMQQSGAITGPPIMILPIINDGFKRLNAAAKYLQGKTTHLKYSALREELCTYMQTFIYVYQTIKGTPIQRLYVHAYGEKTLALLHIIAEHIEQDSRAQGFQNQWSNIHPESIDPAPFLRELNSQIENSGLLLKDRFVLNNKAFCNQLLEDQVNTLHHLLTVHQANSRFPIRQYILAEAIDNVIAIIPRKLWQTEQFEEIDIQWQEQRISTVDLLKHINQRQAELRSTSNAHLLDSQIVDEYLQMLSILIDMHEKSSSLEIIAAIIKPLHTVAYALQTIVSTEAATLGKTVKKELLSAAQDKIDQKITLLRDAQEKLRNAQDKMTHTVYKYIDAAEQSKKVLNPDEEIRMYLAALRLTASTAEVISYDPMRLDRIYTRLLLLYNNTANFSLNDLKILRQVAEKGHLPLPECMHKKIQYLEESEIMRSCLSELSAEGLIEKRSIHLTPSFSSSITKSAGAQHSASSSSSSQYAYGTALF